MKHAASIITSRRRFVNKTLYELLTKVWSNLPFIKLHSLMNYLNTTIFLTDWLLAAVGSSSGSSKISSSKSLTFTCFTASRRMDSGFTRCWWTPEQSIREKQGAKLETKKLSSKSKGCSINYYIIFHDTFSQYLKTKAISMLWSG